jgi:hypothetical protein
MHKLMFTYALALVVLGAAVAVVAVIGLLGSNAQPPHTAGQGFSVSALDRSRPGE